MRFIPMNVPAKASVTIPQLNGGINLYDTPDMVADNQLTACDNMWYHKGALRTRPGTSRQSVGSIPYTLRQVVNEQETLLMKVETLAGDQTLNAGLLTAEGYAEFSSDGSYTYYGTPPEDGVHTAIGFRAPEGVKQDWYFLLSGGSIAAGGAGQAWANPEPYIPTVLINGKGNKAADEGKASVYEDYNMLTSAFKCQFTTDGESTAFQLPLKGLAKVGNSYGKVELVVYNRATGDTRTASAELTTVTEYTDDEGSVTDLSAAGVMWLEPKETEYVGAQQCKVTFTLRPRTGLLEVSLEQYGNNDVSTASPWAIPQLTNNNLTVTAYRGDVATEERLTICRMTRCAWFGGDRSGLGGGTRLFLTGNPDKPGLVHWSGVETPLYFPEGNYAYVGASGEAVTGFGKQGDLLVMFTPHSMAAAQYVAGDEADYTFAQSGGVAVTGYMAHFPITQLNASIGCDCPDTVRLVNNRLVWADSTGRVYMLTNTSAYSERNVREISRNIRRALAAHGKEALQAAIAGEYEGYYILLVDNKLYLLDTQNSAFASFNYYASEDNARKALPWYIWTLLEGMTYTGMVADGDTVRLAGTNRDSTISYLLELGEKYMTDAERTTEAITQKETVTEKPVHSTFATKQFDFSRPDYKKTVEQVYIGIDVPPGGRIRVSYPTERGVYEDPYELTYRGIQATGDGAPLRMRLTPHIRMVQRFGLRLESDSPMTVGGVLVKARQQGVVR